MAQIRMITDWEVGTAHTRRGNECLDAENTSACLKKHLVRNLRALPEDIAHPQPCLPRDAAGAGAMPVPGSGLAAEAADGAARSERANQPAACLPPAVLLVRCLFQSKKTQSSLLMSNSLLSRYL